MSTDSRGRGVARAAFHWLEGLATTVRRAGRGRDAGAHAPSLTWSAFDRLQFQTSQQHRSNLGGEHRSRQRAPSPDFADYRPYQHGDDVRRIDWNVYGRLGELQIRQTEAQLRVPVTLLLDCSASMHWGEPDKLEFARDLATALSRIALVRSDSVSICCQGQELRELGPVTGIRKFGVVEQFLRESVPSGRTDLLATARAGLARLSRSPTRRGMVVLISDLLSISERAALFALLRDSAATAVVLHVVSREEAEPEALGDIDLVDAESGQVVEVGLSVDTLRRYRKRYESWLREMERQCGEHGVRYVRCGTDRSVAEVVLADLRAAKVVR